MKVYSDVPRFLLMHQSLLSHDDINLVEVEDEDLANHLSSMHKNGELDNTVVILMADHGHRFAKVRATHQGQLEEVIDSFLHFRINFTMKTVNG
uniref:Sulfatase domain-containing protein n=1 Tax=Angiostrongylus cantonensis TaxID=6313 RepID=A0A0K0D8R7_ANGCA